MTTLDAPTDVVARVGGWDDNDNVFLNRELSWLAFNARVLQLASDADVPLLEQVRFLSIFSRNLDEFFQVRVSGLFDQAAAGVTSPSPDGLLPGEQLTMIRDVVRSLVAEQERRLQDSIVSQLMSAGIELVEWRDLTDAERRGLTEHFRDRIFPILTPLAVDPGHPFPYVSDLSLNLAVVVRDPVESRELFARVKVPNTLLRWTRVGDDHRYVPLEQVIAAHLDELFPGMEIVEHHPFRVTRNADLSDTLDEAEDLLERRFAIVQVWRAIRNPIESDPLGICDARSLAEQDLVISERRYPNRIGQTYQIAYNPDHVWYYFPRMARDEAIVLKVFDSAPDGRARFTAHSAFADPTSPQNAAPRESIEMRTIAFF